MDAVMIKVRRLIYLKAFNVLLLIPGGGLFFVLPADAAVQIFGKRLNLKFSPGIFGLLGAAASLTDLM